MHLTCLSVHALFPGAGFRLFSDQPLPLLWDCHHGDTFVLKVDGLAAEALTPETAPQSPILEVSLKPPTELAPRLERFAAHHNLAVDPRQDASEVFAAPLTLAAGHLPEARLFIFAEKATLSAQVTPEGNLRLSVAGDFKSRTIPCQVTDFSLHLERPDAARLLSLCLAAARLGV